MYNLANSHDLLHTPTSIGLSLLNYVAFVPTCLTFLLAYVPYVPMRLTCLLVFVPQITTCLRAYVPIYIFHANTSSCLKLFCTCVHSFFTCLRAYNHAQNILSFTSIPCIAVFFLDYLTFHSIQNPKTNSCW